MCWSVAKMSIVKPQQLRRDLVSFRFQVILFPSAVPSYPRGMVIYRPKMIRQKQRPISSLSPSFLVSTPDLLLLHSGLYIFMSPFSVLTCQHTCSIASQHDLECTVLSSVLRLASWRYIFNIPLKPSLRSKLRCYGIQYIWSPSVKCELLHLAYVFAVQHSPVHLLASTGKSTNYTELSAQNNTCKWYIQSKDNIEWSPSRFWPSLENLSYKLVHWQISLIL